MMTYSQQVFSYINSYDDIITDTAQKIAISREAIAGAIAEEYNSQFGRLAGVNDYLENRVGEKSHSEIFANYIEVSAPGDWSLFSPANKLTNVVLNDIGNGNIKVYTAIELLNKYTAQHITDDPLGIKHYNNDYQKMVHDINNDSNSATAKFAGLMLKEAEDFFSTHVPKWSQYDQDYQDALLITYYNLGRTEILKKYNEALVKGDIYSPKPGLDEAGGVEHLKNVAELRKKLNIASKPSYGVYDAEQISKIAQSLNKTIADLEHIASNTYIQDRKIVAENGGYIYLWKDGDRLNFTSTDNDADFIAPDGYDYSFLFEEEDADFSSLEITKTKASGSASEAIGGFIPVPVLKPKSITYNDGQGNTTKLIGVDDKPSDYIKKNVGGASDISVDDSGVIKVLDPASNEINYVAIDKAVQVHSAGGNVVIAFGKLVEMVTEGAEALVKFTYHIAEETLKNTVTNVVNQSPILIAQVISGLIQGRNLDDIIKPLATQMVASGALDALVTELAKSDQFKNLIALKNNHNMGYEAIKGALSAVITTAILDGKNAGLEDYARAAANASIQNIINNGVTNSGYNLFTQTINGKAVPTAAGAGAIAAFTTLASSIVYGQGFNVTTVRNAGIIKKEWC